MQRRPGSELDGCTVGFSLAPNLTGAEAMPAAGAIIIATVARAAARPAKRVSLRVLAGASGRVIVVPRGSEWLAFCLDPDSPEAAPAPRDPRGELPHPASRAYRSRVVKAPDCRARSTSATRFWFCARAPARSFSKRARMWVLTASTLRWSAEPISWFVAGVAKAPPSL